MDQRGQPGAPGQPGGGSPDRPVSADPVTAAQPPDPADAVLAGRDPLAMDEAIGAHDGSAMAGAPGWSTSEGAGSDVATDTSEGRASSAQDAADGPVRTAEARMRHPDPFPEETEDRDDGADTADAPRAAVTAALEEDVVALLDLPRWTEHLRALPGWTEGDRASAMLLRQPPVRVLLSALRADAELGSDGAQETVMLLVLSGAASIEWRGEVAHIGEGELAVVPYGGGWRVASGSPETVLLSTFWGTPGTGLADETGG
ncbi:MAG: hypothetical protein U0869_00360 [Chloroflexota bacterium]